ncbi:putative gustatory receptor 22d [Fopius arisanus]|uniref:Gustatory receptor 22d n=1 Tax=Fopius arisanus TaxID=64838 RepID=A0A9R1U4S4_9HYME|nr:PREDICTED: putative gustatory receptor 22d [Fopius arisanus]
MENGVRSAFSVRMIVENLLVIRQARSRIYKVYHEVSHLHSFPAFVAIFYCCCSSVYNIYFVVMSMITPVRATVKAEVLVDSTFWILTAIFPIVVLSASVHELQEEGERTAAVIYDITEVYGSNKEIECELNNFAIELMHRKISIQACGLFSLDCRLLRSLFATVITYLLILVQFRGPVAAGN